jgi:hypothetical protein
MIEMKIFLGIMMVIFWTCMTTEKNADKACVWSYVLMADIVALVALSLAR